MKIKKRHEMASAEADMTPMIDMTFQLIAFFMILINFSEAEVNERINLPSSQLARPPEAPFEYPLTLQLTKEGTVLLAGDELPVEALATPLRRERAVLERQDMSPADATIIIRADAAAKAGLVQELIKVSQDQGFEKFALRAMQEEAATTSVSGVR